MSREFASSTVADHRDRRILVVKFHDPWNPLDAASAAKAMLRLGRLQGCEGHRTASWQRRDAQQLPARQHPHYARAQEGAVRGRRRKRGYQPTTSCRSIQPPGAWRCRPGCRRSQHRITILGSERWRTYSGTSAGRRACHGRQPLSSERSSRAGASPQVRAHLMASVDPNPLPRLHRRWTPQPEARDLQPAVRADAAATARVTCWRLRSDRALLLSATTGHVSCLPTSGGPARRTNRRVVRQLGKRASARPVDTVTQSEGSCSGREPTSSRPRGGSRLGSRGGACSR